jgi:hypothetical protein
MSEQITFRLKDEDFTKKELDDKADELDISRTDLLKKAIEIVVRLDPLFIKNIDKIAENADVDFADVIKGFSIGRIAKIDAKKEVWGAPVLLEELMKTDEGTPDSQFLYDYLKEKYKKPMIENKLQMLLEKEQEAELTDEEKDFLIKNKKGQAYYNSEKFKTDKEQREKFRQMKENYQVEISLEEPKGKGESND